MIKKDIDKEKRGCCNDATPPADIFCSDKHSQPANKQRQKKNNVPAQQAQESVKGRRTTTSTE